MAHTKTLYNRFVRWSKQGVFDKYFPAAPLQNGFIESFNGSFGTNVSNETLFIALRSPIPDHRMEGRLQLPKSHIHSWAISRYECRLKNDVANTGRMGKISQRTPR